ncbi:hypothetical protein CBS101457_002077 [Exobasidium rhododendri]|nr:hypothetical protein CBS101457_002077 [Exobasidium rhododendri]
MTAYFDATGSEEGSDTDKRPVLASSSPPPPMSSAAPFAASTGSFIYSPARSSDGISADGIGTDDSAGGLSISSEIDTPGPITPATPAWKPKELTLLRQINESTSPAEGRSRTDRDKVLIGLGLMSSSYQNMSEDVPRFKGNPKAHVKDILPIGSVSHFKPPSPNLGTGPRELKLATSTGPPNSLRSLDLRRGSSSTSNASTSMHISPAMMTGTLRPRSPLPVLPPGPTFFQSPKLLPSDDSFNVSSQEDDKGEDMYSKPSLTGSVPSSDDVALLTRSIDEFPSVPDRTDQGQITLLTQPPQSNAAVLLRNTASSSSLSFNDSISAGSRRKRPPQPLILTYSPASSYSQRSLNGSAPNSASNALSFSQMNAAGESLSNIHRLRGAEMPESPSNSGGMPGFYTPLQTSKGAFDYTTTAQHTMASGISTLVELEREEEDDDDEEMQKEDAGATLSTAATASASEADENKEPILMRSNKGRSVEDAFEFEAVSLTHAQWTCKGPVHVGEDESKEIGVDFDTRIFSLPFTNRRQSLEEGGSDVPPDTMSNTLPSPMPSPVAALPSSSDDRVGRARASTHQSTSSSSAMPKGTPKGSARQSNGFTETSQGERRKSSNSRRQSRLSLGPPPSFPLPDLPLSFPPSNTLKKEAVQSVELPGAQSPEALERKLAHSTEANDEPHAEAVAASSSTIEEEQSRFSVHPGRLDRALPAIPKSKTMTVPDVPLFGYTGPISKAAESFEIYSPYSDMDQSPSGGAVQQEEEEVFTSRWSSGSDSDGDKIFVKATNKKASTKQRKNSGSSNLSRQSSRKNSVQTGSAGGAAATAPKKNGFFAGLNLRKKSFTGAKLDSSTHSLESPASSRGEQLLEFPFPTDASLQRQSLISGSSRRGSGLALPSSVNYDTSSNRGSARNSKNMVTASAIAARMSNGQGKKLKSRPSDASIRTTASLQGDTTTAIAAAPMARAISAFASSESSSPTMERKPSAPWGDESGQNSPASSNQQQSNLQEDHFSDAALKRSYAHLRKSLRSAKSSESLKLSKTSSASYRQSAQDFLVPEVPSRFDHKMNQVETATLPLSPFSIAKGDSFAPLDLSKVKSLEESELLSPVSPDETPKIAYATLPDHAYSYFEQHPRMERIRTAEEEDGLMAMGHNFLGTLESDKLARSPLNKPVKGGGGTRKKKRGGRLRLTKADRRPRYPSLTDAGRLWMEERPNAAFHGAQGPRLLFQAMTGGGNHGTIRGGRMMNSTQAHSSNESDSATDDYGSSDGAGKDEMGAGGRGGGREGGGDDEEGRGDEEKPSSSKALVGGEEEEEEEEEEEHRSDDSTSESEDSYGGSDGESGRIGSSWKNKRVAKASTSSASSSSCSSSEDDVPLGQRVQNPRELQRQLRRVEKEKQRADKIEVSSESLHFVLDADDLYHRLVKVQSDRRAASALQVQIPSRSNSTVSRSKSVSSRVVAPPSLPTTSSPLAGSQELKSVVLPGASRNGSPLMPKSSLSRVHTSKGASTHPNKSRPLSPSSHQMQAQSSCSTGSDATMMTALEVLPSSSQGGAGSYGEEYRSAVVADFANTIKARSRNRSFAHTFTSPLMDAVNNRPPVPTRSAFPTSSVTTALAPSSCAPYSEGEGGGGGGVEGDRSPLTVLPKEVQGSRGLKGTSPPPVSEEREAPQPTKMTPRLVSKPALIQHRVYLINRQRAGTAEVGLNARVKDVIMSIMEREPMPIDSRIGGWVLYDVCSILGIERPLREYESVADILSVRTSPLNDYFVLKRTELAPYMSLKNVPHSSAALAGWVYVQDNHRNKKWNKRWLELRENCLYQAKSEKGKDEVLICSLSSFDLYLLQDTGINKVKAPKAFTFALRSQNSINLFESPEADYVHFISLSDGGASRHWITAIINARTFVLRLESEHLFRVPSTPLSAATTGTAQGGSLTVEGGALLQLRQRSPTLSSSSPLLSSSKPGQAGPNPTTSATSTTSPLISFQSEGLTKGSLMEERFIRTAAENVQNPSPKGNSNHFTTYTGVNSNSREPVQDRMRREEVQLAERKGRKEGKPLIAIIP